MTLLPDARMVETGAVGREGIIGVTCGPLNARASSRAISQIGGLAACCPATVFVEALDRSEPMRMALANWRTRG